VRSVGALCDHMSGLRGHLGPEVRHACFTTFEKPWSGAVAGSPWRVLYWNEERTIQRLGPWGRQHGSGAEWGV